MKYLVYENWTVRPDKARIHEATCGHANKQGGRGITANGQWHEGFETVEAALCKARSNGRVVSLCRICNPSISK